jgi:adenylate cyclase
VIVYLDDASRPYLTNHVAPAECEHQWNRLWHAALLERLRQDGSNTVVFDVLFRDSMPDVDGDFAETIRAHGQVVLAADLRSQRAAGFELVRPTALLEASAAATGVMSVWRDGDNAVRRLHAFFPRTTDETEPTQEPTQEPTLAWAGASLRQARTTGSSPIPGAYQWLRYYGPPGAVRSLSFAEALAETPAGWFSNKVVVIGAKQELGHPGAGGTKPDTFASPFLDGLSAFPGVEVHATMVLNLLRSEWLRRFPAAVELLLLGISGAALGLGLVRCQPLRATWIAAGAAAATAGVGILSANHLRLVFPWLLVVAAQIPLAFLWALLFHYVRSYVENRVLQRSLSLYLSPKVVNHLLQHPERLAPGGVQAEVSILSSDIANFSRIAGRMDAEDLMTMLNRYYQDGIVAVHQNDGTVIDLIGDAIFAIWNAPVPQPDHALRAVRAALELHRHETVLTAVPGGPILRTRIGLHTGVVCVGNIGSQDHFVYTAVGEAVNVAFRLEGLNKQLHTHILVTREFLKTVRGDVVSRGVGDFRFKGLDQVVEVHEVLGEQSAADASGEWRARFDAALQHFRLRAFSSAAEQFHEVLRLRPDDGPAQFYLQRIAGFQSAPPPPEWLGEIELREK